MATLKEKMALPPIQHPAPKSRHGERDRNRIRLELRPETAEIIAGNIQETIAAMDVDDKEFNHLFATYSTLISQITRIRKGR